MIIRRMRHQFKACPFHSPAAFLQEWHRLLNTLVRWQGPVVKKVGHTNFGIGCELPLESLGQLQGRNNVNIALHLSSGNLNTAPAKAQHVAPNCKLDKKQQPMEDHDEEFAGGTKQQIEGSPLSEAVIVLDSEDSEEESRGSSTSRLLLARKRFPGKWKGKA